MNLMPKTKTVCDIAIFGPPPPNMSYPTTTSMINWIDVTIAHEWNASYTSPGLRFIC